MFKHGVLLVFVVLGSTWALPAEFWAKKIAKMDIYRNMMLDFQKLQENQQKDLLKLQQDQQELLVSLAALNSPVIPVLTWEDDTQSAPTWFVSSVPAPLPAPAPARVPEAAQPLPMIPSWPPAESLQFVSLENNLKLDHGAKFQVPLLPALNIRKNFSKNFVIQPILPTNTKPTVPPSQAPPTTTICPPCPTTTTTTTTPVPTTTRRTTTTPVPTTSTATTPVPTTTPKPTTARPGCPCKHNTHD